MGQGRAHCGGLGQQGARSSGDREAGRNLGLDSSCRASSTAGAATATEAAGGSTKGTMIEAAVRDALELLEKGAARQRRTVHATCGAREATLGAAVAALQNASSVKASRNVLQMCWKSCMLDPSFMSHSTSRQLHDNTAPTARVGAILDVTITRVGPGQDTHGTSVLGTLRRPWVAHQKHTR